MTENNGLKIVGGEDSNETPETPAVDLSNIVPRNTLVLVRLFKKAEEQRGKIVVPTGQQEYCEAEVLDVGPGNVSAEGGRSETFDLKPGQRVLVQHQQKVAGPDGVVRGYRPQGLPLKHKDGGGELFLFEQTAILAIVA